MYNFITLLLDADGFFGRFSRSWEKYETVLYRQIVSGLARLNRRVWKGNLHAAERDGNNDKINLWHNSDMNQTLINQMTQVIARQFTPERVIVFGSQARETATKYSDVDFLVVLSSVSDKREAGINIRRALARFPIAKDGIVTTPEEIVRRGNLKGSVLQSALREGKVVYERR